MFNHRFLIKFRECDHIFFLNNPVDSDFELIHSNKSYKCDVPPFRALCAAISLAWHTKSASNSLCALHSLASTNLWIRFRVASIFWIPEISVSDDRDPALLAPIVSSPWQPHSRPPFRMSWPRRPCDFEFRLHTSLPHSQSELRESAVSA